MSQWGVLFVFVLGACASSCGGGPPACTPGASLGCTCTSGATGAQICAADGTLGACVCDSIDGGAALDVGPRDSGTGDASTPMDAAACAGCEDGVACTDHRCEAGVCIQSVNHTRCMDGQYCDATRGCVDGGTCADVSDCDSPDGCLVARCVPATSLCRFSVVDRDMDGHFPVACGGDDCNDATISIAPGREERCNGVDEDCDGATDEELSSFACDFGLECVEGECGCAAPLVNCRYLTGGGCADLTNDDSNCSACGHSCGGGATCQAGTCRCADGTVCGGNQGSCEATGCDCGFFTACPVPGGLDCVDSFTDNPLHCGSCGNACAAGELCIGTTCIAP